MRRLYIVLCVAIFASLPLGCTPIAQHSETEDVVTPVDATKPLPPTEIGTNESAAKGPPANCDRTITGILSFEAPAPYSPHAPFPNQFWFGSEHLWTILPNDGIWSGLPLNSTGYTQKVFWWSDLFSFDNEPEPKLSVTGERLDQKAPPLKVSKANNASAADIGTAMLVGVDFPTEGCWRITGDYKKTSLQFTVWVEP
jgi:hypothetical protein